MNRGHVFVVRGRLESIDAEAVIVPTDDRFIVEKKWQGVWGGPDRPTPKRPADWQRGSALPGGELTDGSPQVWFVDSAINRHEGDQQVIDKIVAGVNKVIEATANVGSERRSRPLVAVPTLGVGGGGLGNSRGQLIAALLTETRATARKHNVDVAIVASNKADFAAFQHQRRASRVFDDYFLKEQARALAQKARRGELALFVGAGVSMSAGLPNWNALLEKLSARLTSPIERNDLGPLDLAELVSREDKGFRAAIIDELKTPTRAGLSHLLLAGLGVDEAVTTNFDLLYERAAKVDENEEFAVLPWDSLTGRRPWLLKMHGDIEHGESIVLSRGDFVRYGRSHGPSGAVLQTLMLSRHLLVVGASLTDDNFLRLAYEVDDFVRERHDESRELGTVLTLGPETSKGRLYKGIFNYVDTSEHGGGNETGRALAIFLDALGMYASVDSSFLLDPRYSFLLDDAERPIVTEINSLLARVNALPAADRDKWQGLVDALHNRGARPDQSPVTKGTNTHQAPA